MTTTVDFLESLRTDGVQVWLDGDRLRYQGPASALTAERLGQLKARKGEIVALIHSIRRRREVLPELSVQERPQRVPLSLAQERLWFLEQLGLVGPAYTVAGAVRIEGELQAQALAECFGELVRRHESLRTRFDSQDGQAYQVIDEQGAPGLELLDLRELDEQSRALELMQLEHDAVQTPFDLRRGPLLRVKLARTGDTEHLVMVSMHHIVSDGWSMGVLLKEVGQLYAVRLQGRAPQLVPLEVQYADYAIWQRNWLQGEVLQGQLGYWKDKLAGAPLALELPTDRARPAVQSFKGASVALEFDEAQTAALAELARAQRVTMFMVLLAGFQLVLSRWSGQSDVIVGTPIAGRTHKKTEGMIGFFMNTLPLRTQFEGRLTVEQLLAAVKDTVLQAQAHQDVPFEKLVEILQPSRDLSRPAGFQVLLALQNLPATELARLPGLSMDSQPVEVCTAKLDLSLYLHEQDGRIGGYVEYPTALFDRASIESLVQSLRTVLAAAAAHPQAWVDELPVLPSATLQRWVDGWRESARASRDQRCVHDLVAQQSRHTPQAVALRFDGGTMDYARLERQSSQLAARLVGLGVRPKDVVGLCAPRSPALVVALLAIWKAGAAFLPLDPALPAGRLSFMLDDSGVALVLAAGEVASLLDFGPRRVLDLLAEADPACDIDTTAALPQMAGDAPAYLLYTSGSTGRPKGVLGSHAALGSRVMWESVAPDDVFVSKTTLNFIDALWELFVPLTRGLAVTLIDEDSLGDTGRYVRSLVAARPTRLVMVPSVLSALLAEPDFTQLTELRECVCSGEVLSPALARRLRERLPQVRLVNTYGTTEFWDALSGEVGDLDGRSIDIGRPLPYARCYVLDGAGQPVVPGAVGELHVAGPGLALGYLGQPEGTAQRFVPDPFVDGERMYRTGDHVRQGADGSFEFVGRRDDQVKLRGHRIDLHEVVAAIESQPAVRQACVLLEDSQPGQEQLVAFVQAEEGVAPPEMSALRRALAERLPAHMLPAQLQGVREWPYTPSGKLDRQVLRRSLLGPVSAAPTAPRTTTEDMLLGVWREVLAVPAIGVTDSFFDLGGHSLQAMRMVSRIRELLGVELTLREFLEEPTIERQAGYVDAKRRLQAEHEVLPELSVQERPQRVPLSLAQERLWFLEQLGLVGPAYTVAGAVRIEGELQAQALAECFGELVRRHESLRTRFDSQDGQAYQVIDEQGAPGLELLDLRELDEQSRALELMQLEHDAVQTPFDLRRGPLLRVKLARTGDTEHLVMVSMHHIVSDGWSMGVLLKEVGQLYAVRLQGRAPQLVPLEVQYADYAIWQRNWLQGEVLQGQLGYWKDKLAGAPLALELPTDRARPAVQSFKGASVALEFDEAQTAALAELARAQRVTMFMVLLAGFQLVLSRWSGQSDVIVGTPIAGRTHKKTEGMIGFFMNTLPLRTQFEGRLTVEQLLAAVKDTVLQAQAHQDVPFEKLVEILQPSRDLSRPPLVQVLINSLAFVRPPVEHFPQGLTAQRAPLRGEASKFEMTLFIGEDTRRLELSLVYAEQLFQPQTMQTLLLQLRQVLATMARSPQLPVDEIELGADQPSQASRTVPVITPPQTLVERVAHWADELPDMTAVCDGDSQLSYQELRRLSDAAAARLQALGLVAGDHVGVLADRAAALPVVLLGLQRLGAVACLLDPRHPVQRLRSCAAALPLRGWVSIGEPEARLREALDANHDLPWWVLDDPALLDRRALDADGLPDCGGPGLRPGETAFALFTSGTTAQPRPVVSTLGALLHFLEWQRRTFDLGKFDRFGAFSGLAHDPILRDLFAPLWNGGQLLIPPRTPPAEGSMAAWMASAELTVVHWTPTFAESICQAATSTTPVLEHAFFAGEPLSAMHLRLLARLAPQCEAVNFYGCTETPQAMAYHRLPGQGSVDERRPVLGEGIDGVLVQVMRRIDQPAAIGELGEIVVHTPFLSLGYLGDPVATAERFVPSIHGHGLRAYRTGDVGRMTADGQIDFLGRRDLQVKFRGQRIELGAIEQAVLQDSRFARVAVRLRHEVTGVRRLVAYLVESNPDEGGWVTPHAAGQPEALADAALSAEQACLGAATLDGLAGHDWVQDTHSLEDAVRQGRSVVVPLSRLAAGGIEAALAAVRTEAGAARRPHAEVVVLAFALGGTSRAVARERAAQALGGHPHPTCQALARQDDAFEQACVVGSASDGAAMLSRLRRAGADRVVLCEAPGLEPDVVDESAAVLREATRLARRTLLVESLRAALGETLPQYMVPTRFIAVESLPLTPNGKLDEAQLPVPTQAVVAGVSEFVAPRTRFERDLAAIWCEVLGLKQVSVYDNFFDIGGHSLLLNQVALAIRRASGLDVPLRMLFEAPTIADLAQRAEALVGERNYPTDVQVDDAFGLGSDATSLTLLQLGESESPLYFFHALNGGVTIYDSLIQKLGWEHTIYGFDALSRPVAGDDLPTLEAIAEGYVDELMRQQPHGPYRLIGWSFGGVLAYACGCRLRQLGQDVELLALIDSSVYTDAMGEVDEFQIWRTFIGHLTQEVRLLAGYDPTELLTASFDERFTLMERHVRRSGQAAWIATFTADRLRQLFHLFRRHLLALLHYRPQRFDGRMMHFETVEQDDTVDSVWPGLAQGGCDRILVGGDHVSVLQPPNVNAIVEFLRPVIDGQPPTGEPAVYVRVEHAD